MQGAQAGVTSTVIARANQIYSTSDLEPHIQGVAFSGTTINLTITDAQTGAFRTFQITGNNSRWSITATIRQIACRCQRPEWQRTLQ
jgi:hypothetical protein